MTVINSKEWRNKKMKTKETDKMSRMPIIQTKISRSEDGMFVIHKTIITDIKPVEYYEAVIARPVKDFVTEEEED